MLVSRGALSGGGEVLSVLGRPVVATDRSHIGRHGVVEGEVGVAGREGKILVAEALLGEAEGSVLYGSSEGNVQSLALV